MTTDYKIEFAPDLPELTRKVQDEIKAGWQPIGGVAVDPGFGRNDAIFLQTMIREEPLDTIP